MRLKFVLIILIFPLVSGSDLEDHVSLSSEVLRDFAKGFEILFDVNDRRPKRSFDANNKCNSCDQTMATLLHLRKDLKFSRDVIYDHLYEECINTPYRTARVCKGKTTSTLDQLIFIIDNGKNITHEKICSLNVGPTCHNQLEFFNWTVTLPKKVDNQKEKKYQIPSKSEPLKILHISDVHLDPLYTPGTKSDCGESICCQFDQKADGDEKKCGLWGDYWNADPPNRTFFESLRQMKTHDDIDLVYITGDMAGHRTWGWNRFDSIAVEKLVMEKIRESFNVPVFFAIGNHDPYPFDFLAPNDAGNLSSQWLYETLKDGLEGIIDVKDLETVSKGGYYTTLVKPGLRIIVLNNDVCNTRNLWLLYEDYDPFGQLSWLIDVLYDAEKKGEKVHLVYHIPSGISSCLGTWSREFSRIVSRFSNTIRGQFVGHTHYDDFYLFFEDQTSDKVISTAFNAGSISPISGLNPNYKIFTVDSQTFDVSDFEVWSFNLSYANANVKEGEELPWFKTYSFLEAYGLEKMDNVELGNFVKSLAENKTLISKYRENRLRLAIEGNTECDDACYKNILCLIVTSYLEDSSHCEKIKAIYEEHSIVSIRKRRY